jgi:hypothetical protein
MGPATAIRLLSIGATPPAAQSLRSIVMTARRLAILVLAASALAACSSHTEAPPDPKAELLASTSGLRTGNYTYTATLPDVQIDGVAQLPSHSASSTVKYTYRPGLNVYEIRLVGNDEFTRSQVDATWLAAERKDLQDATGGTTTKTLNDAVHGGTATAGEPERWQQIDLTRISARGLATRLTLTDPDLTGATGLLGGIQTATSSGPTITGTLDPTKLQSPVTAFELAQHQATAPVAFAATLDDQGRLARLVIDLPEAQEPKRPAGQWTLDVANYGAATPQTAPTDFDRTPDAYYQFM